MTTAISSGSCQPSIQRMLCCPPFHEPFIEGFDTEQYFLDSLGLDSFDTFFRATNRPPDGGGGGPVDGDGGPGDVGDPFDPGDPPPGGGDPHGGPGDIGGPTQPGGGGVVIH